MAEGGKHLESAPGKPVGRPLGTGDITHHVFLEQLGAGIYLHLAIFHSNKIITEAEVKEALIVLTKHQEALQMCVVDESEKGKLAYRYVARDDPFDINLKVVSLAKKLDWIDVIKESNADVIDTKNGPLWKSIYCPIEEPTGNEEYPYQFVFMHKSHHAIADAVSVFDLLYRQFLPILSAVVNKETTDGIMPVVPLIKTNEELFLSKKQMENPVPLYMKIGLGLFRWKNRKFGTSKFPKCVYMEDNFEPDESVDYPPFACKPFCFDKELTADIIKSAKTHAVTVHCVLIAINSIALGATAAEAGVKLPKSIKTAWPINMRKFLGWGTPQPLGGVTGAGFTNTKVRSDATEEKFWKMCQKIYNGVKSQGKQEKVVKYMGLGQYMVDSFGNEPVLDTMNELLITLAGSISNIGRCDGESEPKLSDGDVRLKLVEPHFTLLFKQISFTVPFFHGISTFGGCLWWNLTYNTHNTSSHFLDAYVSNIEQYALKYCKTK